MSFVYEDEGNELSQSIKMDDPVFYNIPYFELGAKLVISSFNELFIGDLAFLAMLIGMDNSSMHHCLLCTSKRSDFNCSHDNLTMRTKETIADCFQRFEKVTTKSQVNVMGVNRKGLWDIDPKRIVVPVLHCPMGLVDKVLESFKDWVNLEVEDFHDEEMEKARDVYRQAALVHKVAVEAHRLAKRALWNCRQRQ
jgi:hypothetical protein